MAVSLIIIAMAAFIIAALMYVIVSSRRTGDASEERHESEVEPGRPVFTVRNAFVQSVSFRNSPVPYSLERDDETELAPADLSATMRAFPDLYAEYMSGQTSATRKMEISDIIYEAGFILPLQPGLYEQYRREMQEREALQASPSGDAAPADRRERVRQQNK